MIYLDDDCICLILGYLNLRDQLAMTKVCRRFRDLIIYCVWKIRHRQVYTRQLSMSDVTRVPHETFIANLEEESLNKQEYQDFFALNVSNIRELHIHNVKKTAFASYLSRHVQRPDIMFYLLFKYLGLTVLKCDYPDLHDGHLHMISKNCPMIEELSISSHYITGKWIKMLPKLRRLGASHCNLQLEHLDDILTEMDHLVFLDVRNNEILVKNSIRTWGIKLQELQIEENQFLKQFYSHSIPERLGGIKNLSVFFNPVHNELKQMEVLTLYLKHLGSCVKHLKILQQIENITNLECYNFSPILPCIEELRLELSSSTITTIDYNYVKNAIFNILKLHIDPKHVDLVVFDVSTAPKMPIESCIKIETDENSRVKLLVTIDKRIRDKNFLGSFHIKFH